MKLETIQIVNLKKKKVLRLAVIDTVRRCNSNRSIGTVSLHNRFVITAIWLNCQQLITNQTLYVR